MVRKQALAIQMIRREIVGRYRGSALGVLWSLITPLFMLGVYTFVFSVVFQARWTADRQPASTIEFAIILFTGLIIFQLFAEVVNRAPTLILSNVNYVKKVIFPLDILPVIALGSALFHAMVSLIVLFGFMIVFMDGIPLTALLLPVVLAPFLLMILGFGWFLASLGVFVRDIAQFLGTLVMALMFLSPVFFPSSALPTWIRPYLFLNPVALPIEQVRDVLIWGKRPDLVGLFVYAIIALVVAVLGYMWFQKTRKGFADVL
jgi:lipopolysaccharide transport system permease protein